MAPTGAGANTALAPTGAGGAPINAPGGAFGPTTPAGTTPIASATGNSQNAASVGQGASNSTAPASGFTGPTAQGAAPGSTTPESTATARPDPLSVEAAPSQVDGPSGSQPTSANAARDNAQLSPTQRAQNTATQGGMGATLDNAAAAQNRQDAQLDSAPSAAANSQTRNSPAFGPSASATESAQNPANTGPRPGQEVVPSTGARSTSTTARSQQGVRRFLGAVPAVRPAASAQPGAGGSGTTTGPSPTAGTDAKTSTSQTTTRIYTYGPKGSNGASAMRIEEMNGTFRFSRPSQSRESARRTAGR